MLQVKGMECLEDSRNVLLVLRTILQTYHTIPVLVDQQASEQPGSGETRAPVWVPCLGSFTSTDPYHDARYALN
jgi:hypothetical protein